MKADGWDVSLHCHKRDVGFFPVAPTEMPNTVWLTRKVPQRFLLMARMNREEATAAAIVAVCQEEWVHTPEEREAFLTTVAHLCDLKLGELHDH